MIWFDVDKGGLGKLVERKGKVWALHELLQNGLDLTDATRVLLTLTAVPGRPLARIECEDDDPHGFSRLSDAFTLFAESEKKGDVEKRGRYNLGEKLVLALCLEATIASTKGTVVFDGNGRRQTKAKRERGSKFSGLIRMTRAEVEEAVREFQAVIPPQGVEVRLNGEVIPSRKPLAEIQCVLPTEVADAEGVLRRSERKTRVLVYEPLAGEVPSIYEMGIPVVETGDRWHVNVLQKVPLNLDRDNVPPAFLKKIRVEVLNALKDQLTKADATATWVREAGSDPNASDAAVEAVMTLRFGERRVAYDPSDPEANARAVAAGYTVIPGGSNSAGEWANARRAGSVLPAGKVTPSPRPFSPDGEPLKVLAEEKWTPGIHRVVRFARDVARELLGVRDLSVTIATDVGWPHGGAYGPGDLTLNLGRLGHRWFDGWGSEVDQLLIHEFAHHYESDHLSDAYHKACCDLGARLARLALEKPELWKR